MASSSAGPALDSVGAGRCLPSPLSAAGGGNKSDVPRKRGSKNVPFRPSLRWPSSPPDRSHRFPPARFLCPARRENSPPVCRTFGGLGLLFLACFVCPAPHRRCLPDHALAARDPISTCCSGLVSVVEANTHNTLNFYSKKNSFLVSKIYLLLQTFYSHVYYTPTTIYFIILKSLSITKAEKIDGGCHI